jgi:hypothetical protein
MTKGRTDRTSPTPSQDKTNIWQNLFSAVVESLENVPPKNVKIFLAPYKHLIQVFVPSPFPCEVHETSTA